MRAGYQELKAKGLLTIEELSARLEELETTRWTASDKLEAIRRRAERLAGLKQDRDTLMEYYTGAVPEELERLGPEERRRVYRMLRIEVLVRPKGTLKAHGILGESLRVGSENERAVCDPELALSCAEGWRMQSNILRYRRPSPRETYREPPGTGAKRFTEVRGVSRALEASISFGDRRLRYVRWRRANWVPSLRA